MKRRTFVHTLAAAAAGVSLPRLAGAATQPNVIVILADDLGYGDLGCYGSPISTPNLDRMAAEGAVFRQFCSASPVCSPSRAALLTGRYGVRGGVPYVLGPGERVGLSLRETTLAQTLKQVGYKTMCVGKWHLGAFPGYLPTDRGFDRYFGIPYSNDNDPSILLSDTDVVESPVDLTTVTRRYTDKAVNFIRECHDTPFFLYLAHTYPHIPLDASSDFKGKSAMGAYGDAVEELDWSVGQVLAEVEARGAASNTLIVFTSDNGPWFEGSPGRLRGRKGDTFEGGMRVPCLVRWPGSVPAGLEIESFASMLDLFPTIARAAGAPLPRNPLDGVDLRPVIFGQADAVAQRPLFLHFDGYNIQCARLGRWKLHLARSNGPAFAPLPEGGRMNLMLAFPELYDVRWGPGESYNLASRNQAMIDDIRARVADMLHSFPVEVQSAWNSTLRRPACAVNAGEWPSPPR